KMQSRRRLSFARRLSKSGRALPRIAQKLGRSDRSTAGRLRNRRGQLRRSLAFARESAKSPTTRSPRPQTAKRVNEIFFSFADDGCSHRSWRHHSLWLRDFAHSRVQIKCG